ncbi:fimbrial protein [Pseudomonas sp. PDM13]|uniref:fimbrial protein n=1 Tax=Pseudomonas sp. PDM13 TaxID=2769255 RepID=UPI0021DF5889|nr:fimbrial protein [Pseudomonas sp. PDM13]MCU9948904.1 type 1 fimbrial protein [Pseudomonas sp. PDM13]
MKKLLLAAMIAGAFSGAAIAAEGADSGGAGGKVTDQGSGTVTFTGSIIDAPCSIDAESADQVVELGSISNVVLQADNGAGKSRPKSFQIKLTECSVPTGKTVQTTFTGQEGVNGHLAVTGQAKGAGIVLADLDGKPLKLGTPSAAASLQNGDNQLQFSAYMQGDGDSKKIVPGDFKAVADFRLSYQ